MTRLSTWLLTAAGLAVLGGCGGQQFSIGETAWTGPAVEASQIAGTHALTVRLPTPGWTVELDGDRRRLGEHQVFLTFVEPNPAFLYPQVIAEHTVLTQVRRDRAIEIFARQLEYGAKPKGPYRPAGRVEPDQIPEN
ncbi:MAG: hypothetical protein AAGI17_09575 [Planctomycetota bacterium]